ncbi:MAG: hypothetical protein HY823_06260 [Acidobacteria bacterium]|nr:hypothetical protein [Acidobacteriota bacterium]
MTPRLAALEARVAALEGGLAPGPELPTPEASRAEPEAVPAARPAEGTFAMLGYAGRAFLALAGAFLIRSVTESGMIPGPAGVALGFFYAGLWAVLADRTGRRGRPVGAAFFTATAALIALPLLGEATLKMAVLPPGLAAGMLLLIGAGLLAVSWRCELKGMAWTTLLGSLASGFVLMTGTRAVEAFSAVFLVGGVGVLWLTYGRRWHGLRWPAAFAADLAVLVLTLLAAWPGGPPEAYKSLQPWRVLPLTLALLLLYLGSFVARILRQRRDVSSFEAVQSTLVLLLGIGGAARVAHAWGISTALIGVPAALAGLACYGVAFAFVARDGEERSPNFLFFTTLALACMLGGLPLTIGPDPGAWVFLMLGILAGGLGLRFRRRTLQAHGLVYLAACAWASGVLRATWQDFTAPRLPESLPGLAVSVVLGVALAALHGADVETRPEGEEPWHGRLIPAAGAFFAALVLGGLALRVLGSLLPGVAADPGGLACLRSFVLSGSSLALAELSRREPRTELRWLVYPLLGASAVKLMLEDLPNGRPATLFPAFAIFGLALLFAPRLLRGNRAEDP